MEQYVHHWVELDIAASKVEQPRDVVQSSEHDRIGSLVLHCLSNILQLGSNRATRVLLREELHVGFLGARTPAPDQVDEILGFLQSDKVDLRFLERIYQVAGMQNIERLVTKASEAGVLSQEHITESSTEQQ